MLAQAGNEDFIYNTRVYHCLYDMENFVGNQEPCFSEDDTKASDILKCQSRVFASVARGQGVKLTYYKKRFLI